VCFEIGRRNECQFRLLLFEVWFFSFLRNEKVAYKLHVFVATLWDEFIAEAAQKELRRKGVYLASKKSSRAATEGLLALAQNDNKAAVIELNCETDFVARNDIFQYLVSALPVAHFICWSGSLNHNVIDLQGNEECSKWN